MVPTHFKKVEDEEGNEREIRIGWASWDEGKHEHRSVKWCYEDKSGRIARTSPEVPMHALVKMVEFALEQRVLDAPQVKALKSALKKF